MSGKMKSDAAKQRLLKRISDWSVIEMCIQDPGGRECLILFTASFRVKGDEADSRFHFDSEGITQGIPDHLDPTILRELAGLIEHTIKWFQNPIRFLRIPIFKVPGLATSKLGERRILCGES